MELEEELNVSSFLPSFPYLVENLCFPFDTKLNKDNILKMRFNRFGLILRKKKRFLSLIQTRLPYKIGPSLKKRLNQLYFAIQINLAPAHE